MVLKEFIYFNKKKIVLLISLFVVVGLVFLGYYLSFSSNQKDDVNVVEPILEKKRKR